MVLGSSRMALTTLSCGSWHGAFVVFRRVRSPLGSVHYGQQIVKQTLKHIVLASLTSRPRAEHPLDTRPKTMHAGRSKRLPTQVQATAKVWSCAAPHSCPPSSPLAHQLVRRPSRLSAVAAGSSSSTASRSSVASKSKANAAIDRHHRSPTVAPRPPVSAVHTGRSPRRRREAPPRHHLATPVDCYRLAVCCPTDARNGQRHCIQ